MSNNNYAVFVNGETVQVSEEIYTYIKRSEWNSNYAEIRRKRERIIIDTETQTVKIILSKEDSIDRLMEMGFDFADNSEPIEEDAVRKIIVEQALAKLNADERFIISEIYFVGKTEREVAEELHKTQQNINKIKQKILCKLYEILK